MYATVSYTYRYDDRISFVTDQGGDTYALTCDFLGRYTQIQHPDLSSISCSFDDGNGKVTLTNERGYDRILWYDWLGQLTKVEEEYSSNLFAVTTYQYDEVGHLTSFTDAENHTTSYSYASLFGLTRITYPDSTYEEFEYDNVGNIISVTDANGYETLLTYDDIYRLIEVQYEDLSTVSFIYDLNSNRIKMEDDAPSTGDYVSYEYDVRNRLTKLTYPDDMQVLYYYDDLNRMTEIKRYVDGVNDEILVNNVQYDTESLLTQFDYGNSLRATFTYDSRDRLSTMDIKDGETSFLDLDYTYDSSSNITQLINGWRDTSSTWHSDTESYSYDGLDRLTSATSISWSHTYAYDKAGNRTARDSVTYTINTVNEVTALSDGTTFVYDLNGNRIQKTKGMDTWDYTYDYANRLVEVEKNSTILGEYVYDGGGRRIQVTENSSTTTYIYTGMNILYEENDTGTADYILGPRGTLAKRTTINGESNTFYYHTDHLGSTRLVTDDNKNIVSAVTYQPFGEAHSEEGSEDFLFNGKERDATGLYYYGARYYDPEIGRFITRDPLGGAILTPQSLNRYTYCVNNPLKYTDPTGLWRRRMPRIYRGSDDEGEGQIEYEYIGSPDDVYYWGGYTYVLCTPIVRKKGSRVGVAIGFRLIPRGSQNGTPMHYREYGLLIFFFDENDNIIDIIFIPFSELDTEQGRIRAWRQVSEALRKYGIPAGDFQDALQGLESYCEEQEEKWSGIATLEGGGTAGLGLVLTASQAALFFVGLPVYNLCCLYFSGNSFLFRDLCWIADLCTFKCMFDSCILLCYQENRRGIPKAHPLY